MSLQASVILSTGPRCTSLQADTPPHKQTPHKQTPPRQTAPPPSETVTAADGTHPTGMHYCLEIVTVCCNFSTWTFPFWVCQKYRIVQIQILIMINTVRLLPIFCWKVTIGVISLACGKITVHVYSTTASNIGNGASRSGGTVNVENSLLKLLHTTTFVSQDCWFTVRYQPIFFQTDLVPTFFLLIKETMVILLLELTMWHQTQIREKPDAEGSVNIFNVTDAMCS